MFFVRLKTYKNRFRQGLRPDPTGPPQKIGCIFTTVKYHGTRTMVKFTYYGIMGLYFLPR